MLKIFVTGTDTDVGKTIVSSLLCLSSVKVTSTSYFKPMQSGLPSDTERVTNLCRSESQIVIEPSVYSFNEARAPHRLASEQGFQIDPFKILKALQGISSQRVVIEGAGGVDVPICPSYSMANLISDMQASALLVASTRVGTINHISLSLRSLREQNIPCLGIVLNGPEDPGLLDLLERETGLPVILQLPWWTEITGEQLQEWLSNHPQAFEEMEKIWSRAFEKTQVLLQRENDLLKKDRLFVWHPFTQHGLQKEHLLVHQGSGSSLLTSQGWLLDGISSWWVNLLGHCHPELSRAVQDQAHKLEHVLFAGFTHEPGVQLAETLIRGTLQKDCDLTKVFFSDNGSTAVEVALKLAYQACQQRGQTQRQKYLALRGSYHGDTFGAMSVGDREGFNRIFNPLFFDVDWVDPLDEQDLQRLLNSSGESYAALIVEPLVQGAAGMKMYPHQVLDQLADWCKQQGVLVIMDEIFTGFYRTGTQFAFEQTKMRPDLLCLSKGLTGGYLPLAVTLVTSELFEVFLGSDMRQAFLHGHSYTANPIACAVACKTMEILERDETQNNIRRIVQQTSQHVERLRSQGMSQNVRQLGTIMALEKNFERPSYFKGDFSKRWAERAAQEGVLLRPLGGTIYVVPPYSTTNSELQTIYQVIEDLLQEEI